MITLVQTQTNSVASNTTLDTTFGSSTTNGNAIIVAISCNISSSSKVSSVTDNQGNTYTRGTFAATGGTGIMQDCWWTANITGGATHTVTVNTTAGAVQINVIVREYSGLASSLIYDKHSTSTNGSGTALSAGPTQVTTWDTELIVGVGSTTIGSTQTYALGSGYGNLATVLVNSASDLGMEDKIVTNAGAYSSAFTTGTTSLNNCGVYTFEAAGAFSTSTSSSTSISSTSSSTSISSTSISSTSSSTSISSTSISSSSSTSTSISSTSASTSISSTSSSTSISSTSSSTSQSTSTSSTSTSTTASITTSTSSTSTSASTSSSTSTSITVSDTTTSTSSTSSSTSSTSSSISTSSTSSSTSTSISSSTSSTITTTSSTTITGTTTTTTLPPLGTVQKYPLRYIPPEEFDLRYQNQNFVTDNLTQLYTRDEAQKEWRFAPVPTETQSGNLYVYYWKTFNQITSFGNTFETPTYQVYKQFALWRYFMKKAENDTTYNALAQSYQQKYNTEVIKLAKFNQRQVGQPRGFEWGASTDANTYDIRRQSHRGWRRF